MVTIHPVWRCQCWCGYQKPMICHGIVHGLKKMGKKHITIFECWASQEVHHGYRSNFGLLTHPQIMRAPC